MRNCEDHCMQGGSYLNPGPKFTGAVLYPFIPCRFVEDCLTLTRSPKCSSMALSGINSGVYICIEKWWDIMECCSDVSVASWCLFALKRLFGKQKIGKRKRSKTCKDFFPNLCIYGGNILSKDSFFANADIFSLKIFFSF